MLLAAACEGRVPLSGAVLALPSRLPIVLAYKWALSNYSDELNRMVYLEFLCEVVEFSMLEVYVYTS